MSTDNKDHCPGRTLTTSREKTRERLGASFPVEFPKEFDRKGTVSVKIGDFLGTIGFLDIEKRLLRCSDEEFNTWMNGETE